MGVLFNVFILLLQVWKCGGQANYAQSYTADKMPLSDRALFLADSLVQHPVTFSQLLDIANSAQPLLGLGDNDPKFTFLLDVFMEQLPSVLQSNLTADVLTILADELHRVNVSDVERKAGNTLTRDSIEFIREMNNALLTRINVVRLTQRILTSHSVSEFFNVDEIKIGAPCYNDMITFLDAVRGVQVGSLDQLNFTTVSWALRMLDSFGVPPAGLLEGEGDWDGSRVECEHTHAHLSQGFLLDGTPLNSTVDFTGRYCQLQINQPLLNDLGWGICVPDTCTREDIKGFMDSSIVQMFNLPPASVKCYQKGETLPAHRSGLDGFYSGCVGEKTGMDLTAFTACFLTAFDTDSSGQVNTTEWMTSLGRSGLSDLSSRVQSFFTLDINRDLVIDSLDLHYIFHLLPHNKNQQVSLDNFKQGWTSLFT